LLGGGEQRHPALAEPAVAVDAVDLAPVEQRLAVIAFED